MATSRSRSRYRPRHYVLWRVVAVIALLAAVLSASAYVYHRRQAALRANDLATAAAAAELIGHGAIGIVEGDVSTTHPTPPPATPEVPRARDLEGTRVPAAVTLTRVGSAWDVADGGATVCLRIVADSVVQVTDGTCPR